MDAIDRAQHREAEMLSDRLERQARRAALDAPGKRTCADCGVPIPLARRRALPSATRCVECQDWAERTGRWKVTA